MHCRSLRVFLLLVLAVLVPVRAWAVDRMLLASPATGTQELRLVAAVAPDDAECAGHAAAGSAGHDHSAGHAEQAGHDGSAHHIHCLLCVLIGLPTSELAGAMTALPRDLPRQHLSTWRNAAPVPLFKPPNS